MRTQHIFFTAALASFTSICFCQSREERRVAAALKPAVEADCERLLDQRRLPEALARYLDLFDLDLRSKQFSSHNVIPKLALAIGSYEAAASIFETFPKSEFHRIGGFNNEPFMAICLAKCGRWEDARKAFPMASVKREFPDDSKSRYFPNYDTQSGFLAICWERCATSRTSDPDRAIFYLKRAHEADPKNVWILGRLAYFQFDSHYYEDYLRTVNLSVSIDPSYNGAYRHRITGCKMLIERGESRTMPDPSKFKTQF